MASSTQCGNCGSTDGHLRSSCPYPKRDSLDHWHAAKKQFRREHPEEIRKLRGKKEENKRWQDEGKTIPFCILNEAISHMLQILYDLSNELDVLGRPKEWKEVNQKLDSLLPLIRELANNGKGFLFYGRIKNIAVDGDIFMSRLSDLQERRDVLVYRVKSFVNGKLGKLASVNERNDPISFLRFVYENHPPRGQYSFNAEMLNGSTLKKYLKMALLHYHPDKQAGFQVEWQCICEAISRCLTVAYRRFQ